MDGKRSRADARKRTEAAPRWRICLLLGVLLVALLVAATTTAAQLLWAAPSPDSAATASPAANAAGASTAGGESSSVRMQYIYGGQLRPLVEATGGVQTLNIYGPGGQIIAQVVRDGQGGQEVRYLLADHLGSARVVLDAEGKAVARFEYGPYGETTESGMAAAEVRYRYTGHPRDEAQGVYETPARGYDPTLGRFLSMDPERQDASPYVYAANNPVGYLDTTGGGPTPFIVRSGLKSSTDSDRTTKTLAIGLGAPEKGQMIQDATAVFGQPDVKSSAVRDNAGRMLHDPKRPTEPKYNDKMYWLIGDEEPLKIPGDLEYGLRKLRTLQTDFARSIVLIDISSTGLKHVEISTALRKMNVKHGVVFGERVTKWTYASENATKKSTNTVGMSAYGVEFDLPVYGAYVEGVAEYLPRAHPSDSNTSYQLESVPTQHPQYGLSLEIGGNAGAGSTSATLQSSSEFPSIEPVTQGVDVPPVGSSTVPMELGHVSPFLPTNFMAED